MVRMALRLMALLVVCSPLAHGADIYEAIDSGQVAQVESILDQNPGLLNAKNDGAMTPLNWAAYRGQAEIVQLLLSRGADATIGDNENSQPLHNTAVGGHTNVLEILLASGLDINSKDNNGMTALHFAVSYQHPETAAWLIGQGADPLVTNNNGLSPLHYAALRGFPNLIDRLVALGADVNIQTRAGSTPLLHASGRGQTEAVLKLLALGANTELANEYGRTPLLNVARESGNAAMARILVEHGADINAVDIFGDTPICLAAWRGFSGIVNLTLDHNAEVPLTGIIGAQLLRNAAERGLVRLMNLMVNRGVDLSIGDRQGGSLLHAAAMGGSAEIVRLLLERGLEANLPDIFGWTPLHYAAGKGRHAATEILINHGADINARTLAGHSPFSLAEAHDRAEIKDLLSARGAERSQQQFPELSGPYFGMTLPDSTPQLFAPDIVSTNWGGHSSVAFSPDSTEAFWSAYFMPSDSGYGRGRMVSSRVTDGRWTVPQEPSFAIIEGGGDDVPFFAPDGSKLYFISRRSLQPGGQPTKENIWIVDKTARGWGDPYPAPGEVNAISMHWQFSMSNSGTIYFAGEGPDELGRGDIYRSALVDGQYTAPENLGDIINTPAGETCPLIDPDERYLIFASSGHQSADNRMEIYVSWKNDGQWTKPINTGLEGLCPLLSPDGKYLFYRGHIGDVSGVYWLSADFLEDLKPADF